MNRVKAEQERQQREKRLFLSAAGIGFAGSLFAAVVYGHRRAHKAASRAGETITHGQVNWAVRAFGLGTLYAFSIVGCGVAVGSYLLQQRGVTSMGELGGYMRGQVRRRLGNSAEHMPKAEPSEDKRLLETADRWLDEVDKETGQKKSSFSRIKALAGSQGAADEDRPRLSLGARMRAVFGFNKKE
ncbi:hypothetical protein IWW51_001154 [Coemansia sp. RSA 2702]|nr:hypothetical protein IWW52_002173 [Coemansia sp. RSA 2704]KAJ2328513.1 hypothetical protein IWW51_001154 [Coemansia sp. RSA 2702]